MRGGRIKILVYFLTVMLCLDLIAIILKSAKVKSEIRSKTEISDLSNHNESHNSPKTEPDIVPKLFTKEENQSTILNSSGFNRTMWSRIFLSDTGFSNFSKWKSLVPKNYSYEADIVLGVPTIAREGDGYLNDTISSLLKNSGKKEMVVVVYIAEEVEETVSRISESIRSAFPEQTNSGQIHIISPPKNFYPDWHKNLRQSFGDPFTRIKWRSKQNLDQIFLMMYVYYLQPKYYLMLEDDVIASKDYLIKITEDAQGRSEQNYVFISYCQLGAIGKLFRRSILPSVASFLSIFWADKPLDWLLHDYIVTRVCDPGEDFKKCQHHTNEVKFVYKPSLFQHIGKESSFPGKKQLLKDKSFKP